MLSEYDLELLSAYIDGALSEDERTAVETRLRADPELRRELSRLQAAVDLVKLLPPLAAPRDFRLTRGMARRPAVWASAAFSFASAAAAILLLVIGVSLFRLPGGAPLNTAVSNVAAVPTDEVDQVTKVGDEAVGRTIAPNDVLPLDADGEVAQQPLESRDLGFAAPTGTPLPTQMELFAAALPTQTDNAAGLLADTLQESAADQARSEAQQAAPSVAAGAAAEAPLPAPTLFPSATLTEAPSATPTPLPSLTPTPTPTPTPTTAPTFTPTPIPPASIFSEPTALGGGLIVLALILFGVAIITTLVRRRA